MRLLDLPLAMGRLGGFLRRLAIPFLVALMVGSVAYSLYQVEETQVGNQVFRAGAGEVMRVRAEVADQLRFRVNLLSSLATHWERARTVDPAEWRTDAATILRMDLQFNAVAWLDTSLAVRFLVPSSATLPGLDLDPRDDEARHREFEDLRARPEAQISSTVALADGRRELLVWAPMNSSEGKVIGYLVGVIRLRDLLDVALAPGIRRGYAISVYEGPFLLFGPVWQEAGPESDWEKDVSLSMNRLLWTIQAWPSEELMPRLDTWAEEWTLGFGLFLALLVGFGVDRIAVWKRRTIAAREKADWFAGMGGSPGGSPPPLSDVDRLDPQQQHDDEDQEPDQRAIEELE
jgi:sensor domain CHASE-containing protein